MLSTDRKTKIARDLTNNLYDEFDMELALAYY